MLYVKRVSECSHCRTSLPIVCYYDKKRDVYIIVDGFHRYRVMRDYPDIYRREEGMLPVTVIDKPLDQRMASTIRHNRGMLPLSHKPVSGFSCKIRMKTPRGGTE